MAEKISVIGAGAWGTCLAHCLAQKNYQVTLWVYEPELAVTIKMERENPLYLPGIRLSEKIAPTNDIEEASSGKRVFIMVTPSHILREKLSQIIHYAENGSIFLSASKGIENDTLMLMTEVMKEVLGDDGYEIAVLSGPSFAVEVARGVPTSVCLATTSIKTGQFLQKTLSYKNFRIYLSPDIIGVQLGGGLKNVIAIACGISDGLGMGFNTRAALITRGLKEISRLGVRMGADPLTFAGLAGLGDLVLTCTGELSRNRQLGLGLGRGEKLKDILSQIKGLPEGVRTAKSAYLLSQKYSIDMPITSEVYHILHEDKDPQKAASDLMDRELKEERD